MGAMGAGHVESCSPGRRVSAEVCKLIEAVPRKALSNMRRVPPHMAMRALCHAVYNLCWLEAAAIVAAHWRTVRLHLDHFAQWVMDVHDACRTERELENVATGFRLVRTAKISLDAVENGTCCLGFASHELYAPTCTASSLLLMWLHAETECLGRPLVSVAPSCRVPGGSIRVVKPRGDFLLACPPTAQALMLWLSLSCGQTIVAASLLNTFPDTRWCMQPHDDGVVGFLQRAWMDGALRHGDAATEAFLTAHGIRREGAPALPPSSPPKPLTAEEAWWACHDPKWEGPAV